MATGGDDNLEMEQRCMVSRESLDLKENDGERRRAMETAGPGVV